MKTILFEGKVTALTSIAHNGFEKNGNTAMFRREKIAQINGEVDDVPIVSGNSTRGNLRDIGMYNMLQKLGYDTKGLSLSAFYFFLSGGALSSEGSSGIDLERAREMKELIPLVGVFGGAVGNSIMRGKLNMGKMILLCKETQHIIPSKFQNEKHQTCYEYLGDETYTRTDDEKNEKLRLLIDNQTRLLLGSGMDKQGITKASTSQQMIYNLETIIAGSQFYWKIVLNDVSDLEFEAFLTTLMLFSKNPRIGGKSGVGLGEVSVKFDNWIEIDSRVINKGNEVDLPLGQKYEQHLETNKEEIKKVINKYLSK